MQVSRAAYPSFSLRQLARASVDYGIPFPHIFHGCRQQCMWEGTGCQSSWANIYLKLKFAVLFIPILASVSFRGLPRTSISSYTVGCRIQCLREGTGSGSQSSRADIYLKLKSAVLFIPILASVSIRGLPWTSISSYIVGCRRQCLREKRGAGSQSSRPGIYLKLEFPVLFISILASVSLRQLPWDSAGFLGLWTTISSYIAWAQTTMYLGRGPDAEIPGPIFT